MVAMTFACVAFKKQNRVTIGYVTTKSCWSWAIDCDLTASSETVQHTLTPPGLAKLLARITELLMPFGTFVVITPVLLRRVGFKGSIRSIIVHDEAGQGQRLDLGLSGFRNRIASSEGPTFPGNDPRSVAHLWRAEVHGVEQSPADIIAKVYKLFADDFVPDSRCKMMARQTRRPTASISVYPLLSYPTLGIP